MFAYNHFFYWSIKSQLGWVNKLIKGGLVIKIKMKCLMNTFLTLDLKTFKNKTVWPFTLLCKPQRNPLIKVNHLQHRDWVLCRTCLHCAPQKSVITIHYNSHANGALLAGDMALVGVERWVAVMATGKKKASASCHYQCLEKEHTIPFLSAHTEDGHIQERWCVFTPPHW